MKKRDNNTKKIILLLISVALIITSCSDGGGGAPVDPCSGVSISVTATVTNTSGSLNNGSIVATASGGSGFTFSINGGAFQSSGTFSGLAAATYSIIAKDSRGCTGSQPFTVAVNVPCASISFTVSGTTVSSTPCTTPANGSLTVTTSGSGTGFTYNISGGAFQVSPTFSTLAAGTYTVGAKEAGGCVKTASITVATTPAGSLFSAVKTIINTNCSTAGCHSGATPSGGIDFTIDCNIVVHKARIKIRAVDNFGTAQQMPAPPAAGLSLSNRTAIVNWINAGGLYTN